MAPQAPSQVLRGPDAKDAVASIFKYIDSKGIRGAAANECYNLCVAGVRQKKSGKGATSDQKRAGVTGQPGFKPTYTLRLRTKLGGAEAVIVEGIGKATRKDGLLRQLVEAYKKRQHGGHGGGAAAEEELDAGVGDESDGNAGPGDFAAEDAAPAPGAANAAAAPGTADVPAADDNAAGAAVAGDDAMDAADDEGAPGAPSGSGAGAAPAAAGAMVASNAAGFSISQKVVEDLVKRSGEGDDHAKDTLHSLFKAQERELAHQERLSHDAVMNRATAAFAQAQQNNADSINNFASCLAKYADMRTNS